MYISLNINAYGIKQRTMICIKEGRKCRPRKVYCDVKNLSPNKSNNMGKRLHHFGPWHCLKFFILQKETSPSGSRNSPLVFSSVSLGSLSNHDDDGNENVTNLHINFDNEKQFCMFGTFSFFAEVLVLSTTWNDLYMFCSSVDDVSLWRRMFNFVFLPGSNLIPG